jgi:hypothetical protein
MYYDRAMQELLPRLLIFSKRSFATAVDKIKGVNTGKGGRKKIFSVTRLGLGHTKYEYRGRAIR